MKARYNKEIDILYLSLNSKPIIESDEKNDGIIIDYAEDNSIVGIEVLEASKKMQQPNTMEFS